MYWELQCIGLVYTSDFYAFNDTLAKKNNIKEKVVKESFLKIFIDISYTKSLAEGFLNISYL